MLRRAHIAGFGVAVALALSAGTSLAATVAVDEDALCGVVGQGASVTLAYYEDPEGAELRQVDAYAVGLTSRDNLVLFGRQTAGYSASVSQQIAELPGWRRFRFDRIRQIETDGNRFMAVFVDPEETRYMDVICSNPILGREG